MAKVVKGVFTEDEGTDDVGAAVTDGVKQVTQ